MSRSEFAHLGGYEIVRPLAAGGMGAVYLARDPAGRELALKVLHGDDPALREMFGREVHACLAFDHPGLPRVCSYGSERGVAYLAMDYVRGVDLVELVDTMRCANHALAIAIASSAADALDHAHRCGLVHRDVSPSNIMVTFEGDVKVIDFGIAAPIGTSHDGAICGKAAYIAPEQCLGDPVDARSDVWALGVVLYELATGRPCFVGNSELACMLAVVRRDFVLPSELDPMFPRELEDVILTALAVDPAQRYASAAELAGVLRELPCAYGPTIARLAIACAAQQARGGVTARATASELSTKPELPIHFRPSAAA
ncbi:MAG TPA: serine/threonine-protein kinase [Kofleriaceae bacterium]|jgi:serine/threonine-protein kinase